MRALFGVLLLLLGAWKPSNGTRISGVVTHSPGDAFGDERVPLYYMAKFGVAAGHDLFVFGTVHIDYTKFIRIQSQMALVLLPQSVSNNLISKYGSEMCNDVFSSNATLGTSIFVDDDKCYSGTKDYVRKFPCTNEVLTSCNQPQSLPIINGSNFTFHVVNAPNTEFYYLYMLACNRNSSETCEWSETENSTLFYDINLVNSNPQSATYLDPFKYQFSLELDGLLLLLLLFSIAYLILLTVHLLMHFGACKKLCRTSDGCQMHRLPALFTASLILEFIHVFLVLIHYGVFASNGYGAVALKYLGDVANQFSDWLLILVLLLIGKGWMVTVSTLRWKKLTFGIWSFYVLFFSIFFMWTVIQEQVFPLSISTDHTFQSWPGGFYLAYRLFLLGYILYEMRQIYLVENRPEKLKLYFSLSFLYIIWFCYLPFIVFVIAFINPLFKIRVVSVFVLCFDFLVNLGAVILFAPRWAKVIFQFDSHLNTVLVDRGSYQGLKKNFYYGSSESSTNVI